MSNTRTAADIKQAALAEQPVTHSIQTMSFGDGSRLATCSCGWQSRRANSARQDEKGYGVADMEADIESHLQGDQPEATQPQETPKAPAKAPARKAAKKAAAKKPAAKKAAVKKSSKKGK